MSQLKVRLDADVNYFLPENKVLNRYLLYIVGLYLVTKAHHIHNDYIILSVNHLLVTFSGQRYCPSLFILR